MCQRGNSSTLARLLKQLGNACHRLNDCCYECGACAWDIYACNTKHSCHGIYGYIYYRKSGNFRVKNVHAIIFRVKIFSYASRLYENILTTKIFLQREFRVQRYTYVETHGRAT